jgi:PAS domain S-box-containing protein
MPFRQRFLEGLLESATDYAIIALDLDGRVVIWNEGARRLLGWNEAEVIGRPAGIFFTPEDQRNGVPQAEMHDALRRGRGNDDRWMQRRDGSTFWANGDMMPLHDESGTVQGFLKILHDRTDQRRALEAHRANAEFLRGILAASRDRIAVLDLDARLVFMNESGRRTLGIEEFTSVGGQPWLAFWEGDGHADAATALAAARAGGSGHFQAPGVIGSGDVRWWDVQVTPILGADGAPARLLAVSRDITETRQAAEALRAAQALNTLIMDSSRDCIVVLDLDGQCQFVSPGGIEAMEITDLTGVLGQSWLSWWYGEDQAAAAGAIGQARAGGAGRFQGFSPTRTGLAKWWDLAISPLPGADGAPERLVAVGRDITELKRAQQRLARSEERLNLALTAAGTIGIWDGDLKAGVIYGDANFARIYAVDPEIAARGVPRGSYIEMMHPDDVAAARAEMERLFAGAPEYCHEHRIIHPDGSVHWVLARGRLVRDADGTPVRFPGASVDITDRKHAEHATRDSEARFRSLAQSIPNHVWTARPDGKLDWFNAQVYAYGGAAEGALDGDGWAVMVHPEDLPAAALAWAAACEHGTQYQTEFRLRRHDGAWRWHIARAVPVRDADGEVHRWVGTNTDIHDQKAAEAALGDLAATLEQRVAARTAELVKAQDALRQSQKMQSIGNLTGGVAHDFNNLLQVISGNLQLLARDIEGNERAERRVRDAMAGVARGSKLASQLLAFGRRQPLEPKVVNLGRLLRNMDDILRRAIGEAVEVETIVAGGLWNTLIDPGNVENALLNLAINARDAMDGQGRLTIEAGNAFLDDAYARANPDVTPGQYVMLAVTDTGAGIPPELLDSVFEPFFTTKPEGKGTGLGLSMVYGFVKQSGGHIKIYSEPGHGTTVRLYLPRSAGSEDAPVEADTRPVTGGTETILVAEDDEQVRDAVVAILMDLGYNVLKARDAQSALTIIESGARIDLLFTDVVMPGPLKSTELARTARERLPGLGVLFTSGYTENAIVHGGRLDESVELIGKPYSRAALARKLRHVLANAAQQTAAREPVAAGGGGSAALTFLVVEDDWLIRENTVEMLHDLGHRAVAAADGAAALAALAEQPVDVLLTDVGLTDMSGIVLAERARAARAGLPVIFATGHNELPGVSQGPSLRLLRKPYTSATFAEVVGAVALWVAAGRQG